ncbi:unnamed protein product, partial [Mesorhabditis spiculigera]
MITDSFVNMTLAVGPVAKFVGSIFKLMQKGTRPTFTEDQKLSYERLSSYLRDEERNLTAMINEAAGILTVSLDYVHYHQTFNGELRNIGQELLLPSANESAAQLKAQYQKLEQLCHRFDALEDLFHRRNSRNCGTSPKDLVAKLKELLKIEREDERNLEKIETKGAAALLLKALRELDANLTTACLPQIILQEGMLSQNHTTAFLKMISANIIGMDRLQSALEFILNYLDEGMMKIGEIEGELLERYVTSERKEPNLQQKLMNVRQKMENHGPYGILRIYTAWKKHPDFGCEGRCTHYTVDSEHYMTIRYENRPTNAKNPDFVTAAKSIKRRWYQLNCVSSGCGAFPLLHCANELGMTNSDHADKVLTNLGVKTLMNSDGIKGAQNLAEVHAKVSTLEGPNTCMTQLFLQEKQLSQRALNVWYDVVRSSATAILNAATMCFRINIPTRRQLSYTPREWVQELQKIFDDKGPYGTVRTYIAARQNGTSGHNTNTSYAVFADMASFVIRNPERTWRPINQQDFDEHVKNLSNPAYTAQGANATVTQLYEQAHRQLSKDFPESRTCASTNAVRPHGGRFGTRRGYHWLVRRDDPRNAHLASRDELTSGRSP